MEEAQFAQDRSTERSIRFEQNVLTPVALLQKLRYDLIAAHAGLSCHFFTFRSRILVASESSSYRWTASAYSWGPPYPRERETRPMYTALQFIIFKSIPNPKNDSGERDTTDVYRTAVYHI